jgi:hypothetical protein
MPFISKSRLTWIVGNTLNPVKITESRLVQGMFERIEKLANDILATYAPSTCNVKPPPYSK